MTEPTVDLCRYTTEFASGPCFDQGLNDGCYGASVFWGVLVVILVAYHFKDW